MATVKVKDVKESLKEKAESSDSSLLDESEVPKANKTPEKKAKLSISNEATPVVKKAASAETLPTGVVTDEAKGESKNQRRKRERKEQNKLKN